MKFLHTSDLHLGIRLGEYRLLAEQEKMLTWLRETALEQAVDGVLIAGDIYDRSVPPTEAVSLFDTFLTDMAKTGIPVFAVSGNHDAPERIAYGSTFFAARRIHFSTAFTGEVRCVRLEKEGQIVYIHLLPFLRPIQVRLAYDTDELSYSAAMEQVISRMPLPEDGQHILVCHQFLVGAHRSESEEIPTVGGLDGVDPAVLAPFAYVAAGHLHKAQCITPRIRYAGSPLPYAFSETEEKGAWLAELTPEGECRCHFLPLPTPLCPLATFEEDFSTLLDPSFYETNPHRDAYLRLILTEETEVPDAMARLSAIYPRIVSLSYRSLLQPEKRDNNDPPVPSPKELTPFEVFASFYEKQHGDPLPEEDIPYITSLLETLSAEPAPTTEHH